MKEEGVEMRKRRDRSESEVGDQICSPSQALDLGGNERGKGTNRINNCLS